MNKTTAPHTTPAVQGQGLLLSALSLSPALAGPEGGQVVGGSGNGCELNCMCKMCEVYRACLPGSTGGLNYMHRKIDSTD